METTRIFLIGFMGAGKSSLGQITAASLGLTFIDLDEVLEAEAGQSISELFADKGEAYFRELESRVMKETLDLSPGRYLIATGGGLPCRSGHMAWLNTHGITLYLKPSKEQLISRLLRQAQERPLLSQLPEEERAGFISQLLEKRESYYRQARKIVTGEELSPEGMIRVVLGCMR